MSYDKKDKSSSTNMHKNRSRNQKVDKTPGQNIREDKYSCAETNSNNISNSLLSPLDISTPLLTNGIPSKINNSCEEDQLILNKSEGSHKHKRLKNKCKRKKMKTVNELTDKCSILNENNNKALLDADTVFHSNDTDSGTKKSELNCPIFRSKIPRKILLKRKDIESLRTWEYTLLGSQPYSFLKQSDRTVFTVLSYNVLAQELLSEENILTEENSKYLSWTYRWALLQHEIKHLKPDIMTIQELQSSHYHSYYLPWFTFMGYKCIYKKRTGEKVDGCAVVFKSKKFKLVEKNSVEFNQSSASTILDRDNVGLIVKLTPSKFYSPFCIATTHLLYNPGRSDIRIAQLALFLTELDRITYKTEKEGHPVYFPTILTGDFNAEVYMPLLQFIFKGTLKYSGTSKLTLKKVNCGNSGQHVFGNELLPKSLGITDYCQHAVLSQNRFSKIFKGSLSKKRKIEEELIKISNSEWKKSSEHNLSLFKPIRNVRINSKERISSGIISHRFNFSSVYKQFGMNAVSACSDKWKTVDYIFYSKILRDSRLIEGNLKLLARYRLVSYKEANNIGCIPNDICPSDHLPLAAQFLIRKASW